MVADDDTRAPGEESKFRRAAVYFGSFATQVVGALGGAGGNVVSGHMGWCVLDL
jgi:hypothetical protein